MSAPTSSIAPIGTTYTSLLKVYSSPSKTGALKHKLGQAGTGYLRALDSYPVLTKAYTSAVLNAISEITASYLAGRKDKSATSAAAKQNGLPPYLTARVPKMAAFGFFVSAPLSHYLVSWLQKGFKGKVGPFWKLLQILTSLVTVTPIMSTVLLASMSVVAGARSFKQVLASIKLGFFPVVKSNWLISPIAMFIAQNYLPPQLWTIFFSILAFFVSTYNNYIVKSRAIDGRNKAAKKSDSQVTLKKEETEESNKNE
ncbi:hypothetical protein NADFUDRAFT_84574 [Nadsonia fulvescens var. elongata DSM 6958]|uniref:Integral membrane protein n=1 Tax=Nadsonia fulvescens var. elongata DSM 6958 TaxID=857566 RepID=A0A1E3PCI2_9ASCO|nr:hypothetical protein NADFUDRAFT_84574 [Nadsonia fulvescens var. elongata DSM 6958]